MDIYINKVKIVQHNVLSWKANKGSLRHIYAQISPDIILLNAHGCETKDEIKICGYTIYRKNFRQQANAGTAIAIRNKIIHRINEDHDDDLISIEIETHYGVVEIATDYIPPRAGYLNYPTYYNLFRKKHSVYLLGDLNARHTALGYNTNPNNQGRQIAALIDRNHVIRLGPHFSTFITNRSATSPDIILANRRHFLNHLAEPGPPTPSDHIPVVFQLSTTPLQVPVVERPSYNKADWELYREILANEPNYTLENLNIDTLNAQVEQWTRAVTGAARAAIPNVKYRTVVHLKETEELKRLKIRYTATMNLLNNRGPSEELMRSIREMRHRIRQIYTQENSNAWNEAITKLDTTRNPQNFWKLIKRLSGRPITKGPNYLKDHNNKNIYSNAEKEELFRNHWSNVFRITPEDNATFDPYTEETVERTLNLDRDVDSPLLLPDQGVRIPLFTLGAVSKVIKDTKQRAPGLDGITKLHLSNLPENMKRNLTSIYNTALLMGQYPSKWKTSKIIFIPKGGKSPYFHTNYRPISLLSVPGKILEKLINRRLTHHLKRCNLLHPEQHGFRDGRGTDTALAHFHELITSGRAKNYNINIVLRDVSKAFDKVWIRGLKYKIITSNIPLYIKRVLCNYLSNRNAKIQMNEVLGPQFQLRSGVPQGGCLSPTLYNFYNLNVPKAQYPSTNLLYADDISQVVATRGDRDMLSRATMWEINKINNYEKLWKIKTNNTKFEIFPIAWGRQPERVQPVVVDGREIPLGNTGKILGLTVSRTGYSQHIKTRISFAKSILIKLKRFTGLTQTNKLKLYNAYVRSVLLYPVVPIHTISRTRMIQMQRVQNKAVRWITGSAMWDGTTNEELHDRVKLNPINIITHAQAGKIWDRMDNILTEDQMARINITEENRERCYLKSSRRLATGPPPDPIYK